MMMELAGLSFLGLGAMPPIAEWGSMMSEGRSMLQTSPWVILAPGCAIFISVTLFNLFGDTVRDVLDPQIKREKGENESKSKILALLLTTTLVGGMLTGCAGSTSTKSAEEKVFNYGTVAYSVGNSNVGMNPHESYIGWSTLRYGVGETLLSLMRRWSWSPGWPKIMNRLTTIPLKSIYGMTLTSPMVRK